MTVAQITAAFQAQFQTFLTSLLAAWEAEQSPEPQLSADPEPQPEVETIAGTAGDDTLTGTDGADLFVVGGGDDVLMGFEPGLDLIELGEADLYGIGVTYALEQTAPGRWVSDKDAPSAVIDTSEGVIRVDGVLTLGDWLG